MALLYIMNEYPSVVETFVVGEAVAVEGHGVPVVGYALKRGSASRSAATVRLICPPPTRLQLLLAAFSSVPAILVAIWEARRDGMAGREIARFLLAQLHAAHAFGSSKRAGVTHAHAHFLGRPADVASALAARLGCRWTATAHGSDIYAPTEPALLRKRLQGAAAVACASRSVQETLQRRAAPRSVKTGIVRCGIDTARLRRPTPRANQETRCVVTVGRLVTTKGHWTILESALSLMRQDGALRWIIAGDGPLYEQLVRDTRYRELSPRITLTGALDHAAVLALVSAADVFVLPCERGAKGDSDGIPVALMEAMSLGVPVVTTPVGGIRELVIPDETGFLVPPSDPRALTEALEQVLYKARPTDLNRIREAARAKVERDFDASRQAGALVDLLRPYLGTDIRGSPHLTY